MLTHLDRILMGVMVLFDAGYSIGLRYLKNKVSAIFVSQVVTYVVFLSIFLIRKFAMGHNVDFVEGTLFQTTFVNIPLYVLKGALVVISAILFDFLLSNFDASAVIALSQFSAILMMVGYTMLGDPPTVGVATGLSVVVFGSFVVAMKQFSLRNPLASFKSMHPDLVLGTLAQSFILTASAMTTFLCIEKTPITDRIMDTLRDQHSFPFSFHDPFNFNLGVYFFIMLNFGIFLFASRRARTRLSISLRGALGLLFSVSLMRTIAYYADQSAYGVVSDKSILTAFAKLTVPTIILFGYIIGGEKLNKPKLVGCAIIIAGVVLITIYG